MESIDRLPNFRVVEHIQPDAPIEVCGLLSAVAPDFEQLEHAERRFQIFVTEKHIDAIASADLAHEIGNAVAAPHRGLVANDAVAARERCVAEPIDLLLAARIALVGPGVRYIATRLAAGDERRRPLFSRCGGEWRDYDLRTRDNVEVD